MVVDFMYTPLQRIFEYSPPSTLIKMIKKSTVTEKYLYVIKKIFKDSVYMDVNYIIAFQNTSKYMVTWVGV